MKRLLVLFLLIIGSLVTVSADDYTCIRLSAGGAMVCTICRITRTEGGHTIEVGNIMNCR